MNFTHPERVTRMPLFCFKRALARDTGRKCIFDKLQLIFCSLWKFSAENSLYTFGLLEMCDKNVFVHAACEYCVRSVVSESIYEYIKRTACGFYIATATIRAINRGG